MWDEFKDYFEVEPICAVDMPVLGGVSHAERELLSRHSLHQRVNIVYEWLVRTLTLRIREGGLAAPPPITTRLYQDLSEAMEGYCDATLVSEVPFALPFMQMQVVLELVTLVLLPLVIALFTETQHAGSTSPSHHPLALRPQRGDRRARGALRAAPRRGPPPGVSPPLNEILLHPPPRLPQLDYTMDAHRAHDLRHADEEEPTPPGCPCSARRAGDAAVVGGPPAAAFTDVPAERDAAKLRAVEEADPKSATPSPTRGVRVGRRREGAAGAPAAAAAALAAAPGRRTHARGARRARRRWRDEDGRAAGGAAFSARLSKKHLA